MKYVYILQSEQDGDRHYTGVTDDIDARLKMHNSKSVRQHRKACALVSQNVCCVFQRYKSLCIRKVPENWIWTGVCQEAPLGIWVKA